MLLCQVYTRISGKHVPFVVHKLEELESSAILYVTFSWLLWLNMS